MNRQSPANPEPEEPQPLPVRFPLAGSHRNIAIAVDLSEESAYAVKWAVKNYLRPGDTVILLHVRPTSVLYGADWGSHGGAATEEELAAMTSKKASEVAKPVAEAGLAFKIHIVKDHDMKERLCLEVERLGLCAMVIGKTGSVSEYCVKHCVCPVVVVRCPKEKGEGSEVVGEEELHPVPEEEEEECCHDASYEDIKGFTITTSICLI